MAPHLCSLSATPPASVSMLCHRLSWVCLSLDLSACLYVCLLVCKSACLMCLSALVRAIFLLKMMHRRDMHLQKFEKSWVVSEVIDTDTLAQPHFVWKCSHDCNEYR